MGEGRDLPELHNISTSHDTLNRPSSKLARVVLHLRSYNRTTLADQLGSPVQSTTASLSLVIELVQSLDGQELVFSADGVLLDCIELCPYNQMDWIFVVE